MYEDEIKTLFRDVVSLLSLHREVTRELPSGKVIEYGMVLDDGLFLTYREADRTLHFYQDQTEILKISENSPVLWMFRELFAELEDTDPRDLTRMRLKRIK